MLNHFQLHHKYKVQQPASRTLSSKGADLVRDWLSRNYSISWYHTDLQTRVGFEYDLKPAPHSAKPVSFFKRLRDWYYDETGLRMETKSLEPKIADHWVGGDDLYFDLTDRVDWKPGIFGEYKDSCWWVGDRPTVRRFERWMPTYALGMRFYNRSEDQYTGVGRVWIIKDQPRQGECIFFNSYGVSRERLIGILSSILSPTVIERVALYVDAIHINSNNGILVSPNEDAIDTTEVTIHSRQFAQWDRTTVMCSCCDQETTLDSTYKYGRFERTYVVCSSCHSQIQQIATKATLLPNLTGPIFTQRLF